MTIAIVGANGSGTTLLGFRLFEPASGRVFIDDVDISKISSAAGKQMAVVTQTNVLFEGTIAQNIAYGRYGIDRGRGQGRVCGRLHHRLRFGYEAVLGEGGMGLSGGQR